MQDEMAGERSLGGVLAGAGGGTGAGVPGLLALLLAMEARVPVPVGARDRPQPRLPAGSFRRWSSGARPRGLRTVTVVAAAGSGIRVGRALPAATAPTPPGTDRA